jgi:8-oxo-dGTP diphosphatase
MSYTYEYPRPALTTDAIVIAPINNQEYILLIERKFEPFKGYWALPGGFVNIDEELETACIRELYEETGITVDFLKQFKTFGTIDRDPRARTISVVFSCRLNQATEPVCGDDAAKAHWYPLNNLPPLAFDHQQIIQQFISKIEFKS